MKDEPEPGTERSEPPRRSWWEWSGIATGGGSLAALAALFVSVVVNASGFTSQTTATGIGMAAIAVLVVLGLVDLALLPVVGIVYAADQCTARALAWWCAGAAVSCAVLALIFPVGIWAALAALLGVVFFGGRVEGSRLLDDPAIASVPAAWRWVRAQDTLPRTWRWRLALGRAPWWFGMFAVLTAAAAVAGLSVLGSMVPGSGGGGAAAVVALPFLVVTGLLSLPLFAALGVAVPLVGAATLLLVGTQWFTDGVVLRGRADTSPALRLRARLLHVSFDLVLLVLLLLPLGFVSEERPGAEGFWSWLLLPPTFAARVLYVSVVAAGRAGSTSALRQTGWLVVARPFDVARVLVVQAAGAAGIALVAVPLFALVAVVASPLSLLAGVAHGVAWFASADLGGHVQLASGELVLYCLVCAIFAGRVVAPLLLWHTRHRVEFVQRVLPSPGGAA